jgi:2-dehydropantoate 2-reductase
MILGLSAMSAVTRRPMGEIRGCPESRRLYQSVFEEVAAIAHAEGVDLGDVVARTMATGDRLPPDAFSSMYHDVTRGRRLELDWLHGHALRLADRHRIPAPALFALYAALRPLALAADRAA